MELHAMPSQDHAKLVLASRSPRRRELLMEAGYDFEVVVPDEAAECGVCSRETAEQLVARLARQKAANVVQKIASRPWVHAGTHGWVLVLGCDTVAQCDGQILGKPANEEHARKMLEMLSGREHRVLSGLCLWKAGRHGPMVGGQPLVRVAVTRLKMDRLSCQEIDDYLATGLWEGKAGAFGYQDRLGWIQVVEGSESNVVGLPLELLAQMLAPFMPPCP
jgi:septum formation protein